MIPRDNITEWPARAPWVQAFQLGQDLVSSRAVAEIFAHPLRRSSLAFRGGTALYKLYIAPPERYSEDIGLVRVNAEPIGPVMMPCAAPSTGGSASHNGRRPRGA